MKTVQIKDNDRETQMLVGFMRVIQRVNLLYGSYSKARVLAYIARRENVVGELLRELGQ